MQKCAGKEQGVRGERITSQISGPVIVTEMEPDRDGISNASAVKPNNLRVEVPTNGAETPPEISKIRLDNSFDGRDDEDRRDIDPTSSTYSGVTKAFSSCSTPFYSFLRNSRPRTYLAVLGLSVALSVVAMGLSAYVIQDVNSYEAASTRGEVLERLQKFEESQDDLVRDIARMGVRMEIHHDHVTEEMGDIRHTQDSMSKELTRLKIVADQQKNDLARRLLDTNAIVNETREEMKQEVNRLNSWLVETNQEWTDAAKNMQNNLEQGLAQVNGRMDGYRDEIDGLEETQNRMSQDLTSLKILTDQHRNDLTRRLLDTNALVNETREEMKREIESLKSGVPVNNQELTDLERNMQEYKEKIMEELQRLKDQLENGTVTPCIRCTYPILLVLSAYVCIF